MRWLNLQERSRWLARHILPHEAELRAWLRARSIAGLEIDDVVQECYARLSALDSVEHIINPRTYTFQIAQSVLVSFVRRARIIPFETLGQIEALEMPYQEPSPEQHAADRDELRRLAAAIAKLPVRVREVFVLRRIEGLSQREVADRLGLAESTVEKHMSRGFEELGKMFARGGKHARRASSVRNDKQEIHGLKE